MVYSSGALGGLELVDGGMVGGELAAHVLSAQAAAHAAATAAHQQQQQQQQIAVQQISKYNNLYNRTFSKWLILNPKYVNKIFQLYLMRIETKLFAYKQV